MPITCRYSDDGVGVLISAWDVVTEKEYLEVLGNHLLQDENTFKNFRYSLSDYTAVTKFEVSSDALRQVAEWCEIAAKANSRALIATVVNREALYGLARMFHTLSAETGWEYDIFQTREDAVDWLKVRAKEKYGIDDVDFISGK